MLRNKCLECLRFNLSRFIKWEIRIEKTENLDTFILLVLLSECVLFLYISSKESRSVLFANSSNFDT